MDGFGCIGWMDDTLPIEWDEGQNNIEPPDT
jgi:hypothetical protein